MTIDNKENKVDLIQDTYYLPLMDLNTYVINNECVKNRSGVLELSALDINYKVLNHENIGIQNGKELDIYCSSRKKDIIEKRLLDNSKWESPGYKAYKEGLINIHAIDLDIEKLINKSYKDIANLLNYYFVNEKCIKNRYGHTDEMSKEIAEMNIERLYNIGIQEEDHLRVYCNKDVERRIMNLIEHESKEHLMEAYKKGLIELHTEQ